MTNLYAIKETGAVGTMWKIIGATFDHKDLFKTHGLLWEPNAKAWVSYESELPPRIASMVKIVTTAPVNGVQTVEKIVEKTVEVEVERVVEKPVYLNHARYSRVQKATRKRSKLRKVLTSRVEVEPADSMVKPSFWNDLCMYLRKGACRPAIALVGPAGNGKTTSAKAAMDAMGYGYVEIDCTEYTEPADLIGGMLIRAENGGTSSIWVDGAITRAFKEGLGIILNEYDALNPRAALCLQSVFQDPGRSGQGRYVTTVGCPEHDRVYPQGDCPVILSLNTYGTGGSRQYVGRNTMDAASIDRLTIITTGYENEAAILVAHGYAKDTARRLEIWAAGVRKQIDGNQLKVILSNRTLIRMAQGIDVYGWSWETAVEKEFLSRFEKANADVLKQAAYTIPPARVERPEIKKSAPASNLNKPNPGKRLRQTKPDSTADTADTIDAILSAAAVMPVDLSMQFAVDTAMSLADSGTLDLDTARVIAQSAQQALRKAQGQS